jgi:predicted amidohydrolase YtcJ
VFTGVSAAPWAEALTVVGDRIGVVGTTASVRQLTDTSTRVIDAEGRVVIPGLKVARVLAGARPPSDTL